MPARLPSDLPVAAVLDEVVHASRSGAVVVTAPPGSGKTMLVPAAVLDDLPRGSRVVLLQPRRLAARAVARQIAHLRGGEPGGEVGYQVRFESCVGRDTRLIVETTGIMLRRLVGDVALESIGAVVLDEFHERTLEMDLVLGLLIRLRETLRPDLRIIVMSATLAAEPVAALLGRDGAACRVVSATGRMFPVEMRYLKHGDRRDLVDLVTTTVPEAVRATAGHVLVFLPGVGEILRCQQEIAAAAERQGHAVVVLYGDLAPDQQDSVLADIGRRKVILSTNVAETSLTIPGVTAVIDSGLARQSRVSHATGLPRLELVPIAKAAADQRAGRAGRTAAGICWRLWDESSHQHRAAAEMPEAVRGDLAGPLLQLLALNEDRDFPWLDPPPPEAVANARGLLAHLGAIECDATGRDRVTPLGTDLLRLPAHPRLARLLLAGAGHGVLREASIAAALLSERDPFRVPRGGGPRDRHAVRTRSDVVDRIAALQALHAGIPSGDATLDPHPAGGRNVLRVAEQLYRLVDVPLAPRAADPAAAIRLALLEAFPDRLARLRPGTQDRGALVGGRGLRLDSSRVRGEPLFLAVDLDDSTGEAGVRQASAVERAWLDLEPLATANLSTAEELLYHPSRRQVEARLRTSWMDLVIDEAPTAIRDHEAAAAILALEAAATLDRLMPAADTTAGGFLARCRWLATTLPELALPRLDDAAIAALLPDLCRGLRSLDEVKAADWAAHLHALVGHDRVAEIERLAPMHIDLPTGKRHRITYDPAGGPLLAIRIQELFGVRETPRIGGGRVPVLLHLLGPNHRPQQVTSDLASFWANTYPSVKKELRRRYPKHAWPDDPLAPPARKASR
ncbi:MAG: ATP-dependent helicase HrpB [Planctomycetia bacterium]|nr:ATP-dependent helicase HrpB [Planctomycetia bacterium]